MVEWTVGEDIKRESRCEIEKVKEIIDKEI